MIPRTKFGRQILMRQAVLVLTACIVALLAVVAAFGQHTVATKFDVTKTVTLKGTVTQIDWSNPYVHIIMKVPGNPRPVIWAVELDSAIALSKNGWNESN